MRRATLIGALTGGIGQRGRDGVTVAQTNAHDVDSTISAHGRTGAQIMGIDAIKARSEYHHLSGKEIAGGFLPKAIFVNII